MEKLRALGHDTIIAKKLRRTVKYEQWHSKQLLITFFSSSAFGFAFIN